MILNIDAKKEEPSLSKFLKWEIAGAFKVLFINLEIKKDNFHRRLRRMCSAMGVSPEAIKERLFIANLRGHQINEEHIMALARQHAPDVILIDPLYKILTGDENAASDMKPVLAMFDRITLETGATVISVHHNPKGRAGDRDVRDRGAGSGVLARDYDASLVINDHALQGSHLVLSTVARNYPPSEPCSIEWESDRFVTSDVAPIELTTKNANSSARRQIEPSAVVDMLKKEGPKSKQQLKLSVQTMGSTRDQADDIIKRMVSEGTIMAYRERKAGGVTWHGTKPQIDKLQKRGQ